MSFTDIEKGMAKRTLKQFCCGWGEFRYDEIHGKPYFIGKREKNSAPETLFPVECSKTMTFEELENCIRNSGSSSVNLAVYNTDSTVVMYKAELGLKPPSHLKEKEIFDYPSTSSANVKESTASNPNIAKNSSVYAEQVGTDSASGCLQIDLQSADDSETSETENDDSDELYKDL